MADKADWAAFSEDEDDEPNEPQQQASEGKTQESYQREGYTGDPKANQGEEEARTSNYVPRGRGGRGGGRGERRGGRGRGRGGRDGGRDGGGGRDEGPRGDRDDRRPKQVKENQPKGEMINLIRRGRDEDTFINLFDVDFKATPEDIRSLYPEVKIMDVNMIKPGLFLVELFREEAVKMVEIGPKSFNQREFYMKLGYSNKRQNPEEQYHNVNVERHKYDVGNREDRPRRGGRGGGRGGGGEGKFQHYNRRDQFGEEASPGYHKDNRNREGLGFNNRAVSDTAPVDTENKFFAGHDLRASEFKIRFTNSSKRESEANETIDPPVLKPNKSNPFGEAVARDEKTYVKKKEEEKHDVEDPQKQVEEKKEPQQQQVQAQPQPQEQKLGLTAPVNSVDSQNPEAVEEARKTGPRFQFEDKRNYQSGGYGNKKSGFVGKGPQVVYEARGNQATSDYQGDNRPRNEDYRQKNKYQEDTRPNKGFSNNSNNKYNKFDALK